MYELLKLCFASVRQTQDWRTVSTAIDIFSKRSRTFDPFSWETGHVKS